MNRHNHLPRRRRILAAAFVLAAAALTGPARAASDSPPEPTEAQRQACIADFQRLCPGTRPGGGRVRQCFEANLPDLSPLCREAYEAHEPDAG